MNETDFKDMQASEKEAYMAPKVDLFEFPVEIGFGPGGDGIGFLEYGETPP